MRPWKVAACLIVTAAPSLFATAYEFTSAPATSDSQLSLGFVFTTNTTVTVSSLGYYDYNGDGFLTNHEVGIFDSTGNLLISTLLLAGTADPLVGHFRYQSIPSFVLPAGQSFTLAATTFGPSDLWAYGHEGTSMTGFVVDPQISIDSNAARFVYQSDNVLRDPGNHFSDYTVYAGPNFQTASAVPEPGTALLVVAPLALVLFRRCRGARS